MLCAADCPAPGATRLLDCSSHPSCISSSSVALQVYDALRQDHHNFSFFGSNQTMTHAAVRAVRGFSALDEKLKAQGWVEALPKGTERHVRLPVSRQQAKINILMDQTYPKQVKQITAFLEDAVSGMPCGK